MAVIPGYMREANHSITTPGLTFSIPPQEDFTIFGATSGVWDPTMLADREIAVQYSDLYFAGRINQNIYTFITNNMIGSGLTFSGNVLSAVGFNGVIFPVQAATASAPTYIKGGIYFDTTLSKLRVGGASGWETITSV
jgi:hypothetical protein